MSLHIVIKTKVTLFVGPNGAGKTLIMLDTGQALLDIYGPPGVNLNELLAHSANPRWPQENQRCSALPQSRAAMSQIVLPGVCQAYRVVTIDGIDACLPFTNIQKFATKVRESVPDNHFLLATAYNAQFINCFTNSEVIACKRFEKPEGVYTVFARVDKAPNADAMMLNGAGPADILNIIGFDWIEQIYNEEENYHKP